MYRTAWKCSVLLAGATGAWACVSALSPGGALVLFVFVGSNAACIRHMMSEGGGPSRWQQAVRVGLVFGALVVAACGLVAWLGLQGLIVVVLLTLLSPTVLTTAGNLSRRHSHGEQIGSAPGAGHWHHRQEPARADVVGRAPDPTAVIRSSPPEATWINRPTTSMDDATLCFAWRVSFVALQQPLPLPSRLQVVNRRQEFLDELERRNPPGFQNWLASGARAAADPTRYITRHDENRHDQR